MILSLQERGTAQLQASSTVDTGVRVYCGRRAFLPGIEHTWPLGHDHRGLPAAQVLFQDLSQPIKIIGVTYIHFLKSNAAAKLLEIDRYSLYFL